MNFCIKRLSCKSLTIAITATLVFCTKVNAQDLTNATVESGTIQSVVVTAQKREEDASKVPVSMSVVNGEELAAQHINDYADLTRAIPNMSFSGGGPGGDAGDGPGLSNLEMRGISSGAGAATVGIYMDDVSMTVANLYSMGSPEPQFFDVDRVEVLRGPQGTLYGASSMGGTIKFITNQPNLKEKSTDVYTEFSSFYGGKNSYKGNIVVNQPLIPNELALRFGVQAGHQGGYIDQVNSTGEIINSGINSQDDSVTRLALKWVPTRNLTITPAFFYQKVKTGDTDVSYDELIVNGKPTGQALPKYRTNKTTSEPGSDELLVPSLTINYVTDFGDFTSITSYFKRTFTRVQDGSVTNSVQLGTSGNFIDNNTFPALGAAVASLPSAVTLDNQVEQFSQEIRFASKPYEPGGSPFTWLMGAYIANEHTRILEGDYVFGLNRTFANFGFSPIDPNLFVPGTYLPGFPNDNTYSGDFKFHETQQSLFGEMNYYFTPNVHATVGLRYIHASEAFSSFQSLFFQGGNTYNNSTQAENKLTPRLSFIWEITPKNSIYATVAEGFRVGGNNGAVPFTLCGLPAPNPLTFNSDSLWSYELGNKSRFFNNKLMLNASLFYVKWKDMQQSIELPCDFDYSVNVGSATSYGGEIELMAKPISSVLIGLNAGYTHATLDNNEGAESGVVGAIAGANIPGVPRYNIALTATYNYNITDRYAGFLRAAARWTGLSHGGFAQLPNSDGTVIPPNIYAGITNPDFNRPAYHTVDFSTGLSWDEWEATLFVKNVFNNNMVIQRPIEQATLGEVYRIEPRTIGLSLSARF